MDNWNSNCKILKCFILIVFSYNCSGQVGVRNAFDNRDIYSLNFYSNSNESNNESKDNWSNDYKSENIIIFQNFLPLSNLKWLPTTKRPRSPDPRREAS